MSSKRGWLKVSGTADRIVAAPPFPDWEVRQSVATSALSATTDQPNQMEQTDASCRWWNMPGPQARRWNIFVL
jgi:hypothetical protein